MTTLSKTKSSFEQLLSEIYARRPLKNNQQVYIDCLKPSLMEKLNLLQFFSIQ